MAHGDENIQRISYINWNYSLGGSSDPACDLLMKRTYVVGECVDDWSSNEDGVCSEGESFEHVSASSHSAVQVDFTAASHRPHHLTQYVHLHQHNSALQMDPRDALYYSSVQLQLIAASHWPHHLTQHVHLYRHTTEPCRQTRVTLCTALPHSVCPVASSCTSNSVSKTTVSVSESVQKKLSGDAATWFRSSSCGVAVC